MPVRVDVSGAMGGMVGGVRSSLMQMVGLVAMVTSGADFTADGGAGCYSNKWG